MSEILDEVKRRRIAEFQERVRVRLAVLGMSQADLARDHGMSPQSLHNIVKSGPYVTFRNLEKLAEMLGVRVGWLVDGSLRDGVPSDTISPEKPL